MQSLHETLVNIDTQLSFIPHNLRRLIVDLLIHTEQTPTDISFPAMEIVPLRIGSVEPVVTRAAKVWLLGMHNGSWEGHAIDLCIAGGVEKEEVRRQYEVAIYHDPDFQRQLEKGEAREGRAAMLRRRYGEWSWRLRWW
jgi:hypothetical protein